MKIVILKAALTTAIGVLSVLVQTLGSDAVLTTRATVALVAASLLGGANALQAYLSKSFAESQQPNP